MNIQTVKTQPLSFAYETPKAYDDIGATGKIMAAVVHGDYVPTAAPWPQPISGLPPLDGEASIEVVRASNSVTYGQDDGFQLACTDDLLFASYQFICDQNVDLSPPTEDIYIRLLRLVRRHGYPYLLRMWNIVPHIHCEDSGLERYKQFCHGRYEAFQKEVPALVDRYPAACALGSKGRALVVYFLAARSDGQPVENPRQVSAFRYPPCYGPRSPSFSRALVKSWGGSDNLFLSGTASITGHETRHEAQLAAQIDETLNNFETLIAAAAEQSGGAFSLAGSSSILKAYIRRRTDYGEARRRLEARIGSSAKVLYLQADICRRELLFEIDGTISAPLLS